MGSQGLARNTELRETGASAGLYGLPNRNETGTTGTDGHVWGRTPDASGTTGATGTTTPGNNGSYSRELNLTEHRYGWNGQRRWEHRHFFNTRHNRNNRNDNGHHGYDYNTAPDVDADGRAAKRFRSGARGSPGRSRSDPGRCI